MAKYNLSEAEYEIMEYISSWTKDLLDEEFDGSLAGFLLAFTGGKKLSREAAEELHKFLDE